MTKKVLVLYYTQTGQLLDIVHSVTTSFSSDPDISIVYEELRPKPAYPFPWTSDEFFQVFPESVRGIPCELEPFSVSALEDFDLIIIAYQPWYLSPSIPLHAFFQNPSMAKLIAEKPVITIIGCRNMWVMGQEKVKEYISAAGGKLVGNIVLNDRAPNLLSVISVMRWMLTGDKGRYLGVIPPAGVSDIDIAGARRFGPVIYESLVTGNYIILQRNLLDEDAVVVKPLLVMFEKRAIIFFRIWANFILRKGSYGDKSRVKRLRAFKYYLLAVIYLISPLATVFFLLFSPFRRGALRRQKSRYQSL